MSRIRFLFTAQTLALLALVGCSSSSSIDPEKDRAPQVFRVATRRLPPEPTYSRLRWANMSPLPSRDLVGSTERASNSVPLMATVMQFEARDTTLEDAAKMLATSAQYSSYCASTIAAQKITLNRLGTIDELGEAISLQAGIKVVVDHEGRSVRFFPQQSETPQFFGSAAK